MPQAIYEGTLGPIVLTIVGRSKKGGFYAHPEQGGITGLYQPEELRPLPNKNLADLLLQVPILD